MRLVLWSPWNSFWRHFLDFVSGRDPSSGCKLRKQIGVGKAEAVGSCWVDHWRGGSHAVGKSQSGEILLNKRPFYKNKNPSKAMP